MRIYIPMQHEDVWHPIAFYSKSMSGRETNYEIHDILRDARDRLLLRRMESRIGRGERRRRCRRVATAQADEGLGERFAPVM